MWPQESETEALLAAAKTGAPPAIDRLLEKHREAIRRAVACRMDRALSRRVDASDVVQDVLLEASRRLPDYLADPKMPFQLWLRHLARDRVIDTHRRHRVAQRRSLDREQSLSARAFSDQSSVELAAQLCDHELTPAAAAMRQELERRFLAAVDQLGDDDREIIVLRHFEQYTNEDAARELGLTPPAAGMRHLRALRRLKALLGEKPSR